MTPAQQLSNLVRTIVEETGTVPAYLGEVLPPKNVEPMRTAIHEFALLPWRARLLIVAGVAATGAGAWFAIILLDALSGGPR